MKNFICIVLFLAGTLLYAQNFEDQWEGHFSFVSIKDISKSESKLYVASENAIFIYDLATKEISTRTTLTGLDGSFISTIHYSEDYGVLFIGYENGLMDVLIDGEEEVLKVVDIVEKPSIPPNEKRINHFNEYNGVLYLSTQYGISLYDIERLEFGDSYFIGNQGTRINVLQTTILEPFIYAATSLSSEGLKRADVENPNLIDFEEWTTIRTGAMFGVQAFAGDLYYARTNNAFFKFQEGSDQQIAQFSNSLVDFRADDDVLTVTSETRVSAYGPGPTLLSTLNSLPEIDDTYQCGMALNNFFYLGTSENGLLEVPFNSTNFTQILPDGPILNTPFAIDTSPGQLWVAFGDITQTSNPFPLSRRGISNLRDGEWLNIPYEELFGATDLVNVTINPDNPNEVYISSYYEGLLKIENQEPIILYDETNSNLEEFIYPSGSNTGIRLYGSKFDVEGNLWFVQSRAPEGLLRLTPSQQVQKIDLSSIIEAPDEQALQDVEISREGYIFIASTNNGLLGYDPASDTFNKIGEGLGQGNLPKNKVVALDFDQNNRLWIGTTNGLRVLFTVGAFFDTGETVDAQEIIIEEDGVAQELLFEQSITDIETDGSNNKWISTSTSGVFYLSSNGQETLLRFTKDNSPLPSNNVQDIAIDSSTGIVYFATVNGLVAFKGTSTAPRDNLENVYAFPNPVRPGFTGNVTIDGLTDNANVKITDIEGNLVFETTSEGGSVLWDTTAFGKYRVASGVYMVLITSDDAIETKITKIMVVR